MHQGQAGANVAVTSAPNAAAAANGGGAPLNAGQQQQPQQVVMNAAGGQAMFDDDDDANRDWLDISYMFVRFSLLLMGLGFGALLMRRRLHREGSR